MWPVQLNRTVRILFSSRETNLLRKIYLIKDITLVNHRRASLRLQNTVKFKCYLISPLSSVAITVSDLRITVIKQVLSVFCLKIVILNVKC